MKYRQAIKIYSRQGELRYKSSTVKKAMAVIQLNLDRHLSRLERDGALFKQILTQTLAADSAAYAAIVTSATVSYLDDLASPFYKKELGETND